MRDLVILGVVIFVLWYAVRNGIFAQLGGGYAMPRTPHYFDFQTPYGNYGGGF